MEVIEKVITHSRPDKYDIYGLGDIHAGSINCAENDVRRKVEEIHENKNALVIGMGDYADCITKNDKRFEICGLAPWVKADNIVESQRNWLRDLLKPIASKFLCLLTGNHEEMIHDEHSADITRNLCDDLNIPYGGYHCFVELIFRRGRKGSKGNGRKYVCHAWHGAGSAQTEGARLMRLMRLVNDIEADIYLMGHLHSITSHTPDRLCCLNGKVRSSQLIATITGSWLKTYMQPKEGEHINPSYGEEKGYKPARLGCPIIHIWPDRNLLTLEA